MDAMKLDPYNHRERWVNWRIRNKKNIKGLSRVNSKVILEFLSDMEIGRNTSPNAKKGPRSYIRLNSLQGHICLIARLLNPSLLQAKEKDILSLFENIRNGIIKRQDGNNYTDTANIIKDCKAFYNWALRTHRIKTNIIQYLSRSNGIKPPWVYLNQDQWKLLYNSFYEPLKPIILLMYDSGMRVTEAYNVKVSDFSDDFTKLNIRPETSKTFGRKITLTFSRLAIKEFIKENKLKSDDRIFIVSPSEINKQLKKASARTLPNSESPARENYHNITLYDLRHNAACYWLPKYPTLKGLMYRMGWKKENEAYYYSEFLGFSDEIQEKSEYDYHNEFSEIKGKVDLILKLLRKSALATSI